MARPTKLTPEAHEQIVRALTAGATRTDAVASIGVEYTTFLDWMKRGASAKSGAFYEFYKAATNAEASVRISLANSLAVAGKTDWRAAEAYLKRRDPANWGDKLAGADGGPLTVKIVVEYEDKNTDGETPQAAPESTSLHSEPSQAESDSSGAARREDSGSGDAGSVGVPGG